MTRRNRTLRLIAMLVVLAGTLVSLVAPAIRSRRKMTATRRSGPRSSQSRFCSMISIFFDREIPIAPEGLVEVGQQDDLTFYAETAEGPHDRLFVSLL